MDAAAAASCANVVYACPRRKDARSNHGLVPSGDLVAVHRGWRSPPRPRYRSGCRPGKGVPSLRTTENNQHTQVAIEFSRHHSLTHTLCSCTLLSHTFLLHTLLSHTFLLHTLAFRFALAHFSLAHFSLAHFSFSLCSHTLASLSRTHFTRSFLPFFSLQQITKHSNTQQIHKLLIPLKN